MEIQTILCGNVNVYLVCGSILIDTGRAEQHREAILKVCHAARIKLILLTHGHVDHCLNAACLAAELGCPVGIGAEDIPLVRDDRTRKVYGNGPVGRVYAMLSNRVIARQRFPQLEPKVILEDGMTLAPYGVEGKVIALPGHTAGSMGVLLDSGELFVGDAMQNLGVPDCAWCYENREEAERSARLIRSMRTTRVYYGHGRSTPGP